MEVGYDYFISILLPTDKNQPGNVFESTDVRWKIWQASFSAIKENIIVGVGTGDVKETILNKYKEMGMEGAYQKELNPHSQYLQSFLTFGISGIVLLLASFILPMYFAFKHQQYLYLYFIIMIMLFLTTESLLEVQGGVLFYSFFNSFFMFMYSKSSK